MLTNFSNFKKFKISGFFLLEFNFRTINKKFKENPINVLQSSLTSLQFNLKPFLLLLASQELKGPSSYTKHKQPITIIISRYRKLLF